MMQKYIWIMIKTGANHSSAARGIVSLPGLFFVAQFDHILLHWPNVNEKNEENDSQVQTDILTLRIKSSVEPLFGIRHQPSVKRMCNVPDQGSRDKKKVMRLLRQG
jgi:hypothetical protein